MNNDKVCDVCVFCALWDEAKAVRDVFSKLSDVTFVQDFTSRGAAFLKTTILNKQEESLTVHLSWLPEIGGMQASAQFDAMFAEFKPRFAGMTGICAADRASAALGDLVIAKFAYEYGAGKIVIGEDGKPKLKPEIKTFGPHDNIVQWTQSFETWKNDVAALRRPISKQQQADWILCQLLNPETPRITDIPIELRDVHTPAWKQILIELRTSVAGRQAVLTDDGALHAPEVLRKRKEEDRFFPYKDPAEATAIELVMGSGPAVRSDYPFPELQEKERKLGAIEMEAANFYFTANHCPELLRRCLVVKGVSDYADPDKDDSYREYASKAAAVYIFHFVREFVNSQQMPRPYFEQTGTRRSHPLSSSFQLPITAFHRVQFVNKLNAIPKQLFDQLVYALHPPPGIIPSGQAPQGDRTTALLSWAEAPGGCGVAGIEQLLETILHR